jgi:site-specific DNA-methyltransferase (adenine-specific)
MLPNINQDRPTNGEEEMKNGLNLIHGDCIEEMAAMPENSIDLTVTSPPYDNLRTYKDSLQWNESIWKDILKGLYRTTAEGGVVVWIVSDGTVKGSETGTSFKQALYAMECGFRLYDTMIWQKPSPQAPTEGRYYEVFEYMFIFSKGKPKALNLLKDRKNKSFGATSRKETRSNKEDRKYKEGTRTVKEYSRRFNVWDVSRGASKTSHPAVFPEQLAHDHIVSWSNEGDVVFDPFMGSGTTGKMALQLGRKFVGVEKVEEYFKIASDRIFDSAL